VRTFPQRLALLKYNAKRCEQSKHARCSCACGGVHHGKPHGDDWFVTQANRLADQLTDEVEKRDAAEGRPGLFA